MLLRNRPGPEIVEPSVVAGAVEQGEPDGGSRQFLGYDLASQFQPILARREDGLETVAYKALLRISRGGFDVGPAGFFDTLSANEKAAADVEATGLHLHNFMRTARTGDALVLRLEPASIRSSLFSESEFRARLTQMEQVGLHPRRIIVELDMAATFDAGELRTFATMLRRCGVRLSLAGFDADRASFGQIAENQPDMVGFDRSWLELGLSDPIFRAATERVVAAMRGLGPSTLFSRIEDGAELDFALSCGFTHLQGWQLGHPAENCRPVSC